MSNHAGQPYLPTFLAETAPAWLNHAAHLGDGYCHDLSKPFRYLDIGCGYGYGLAIYALTHPHAEFIGIDHHPVHTASLRQLAKDWELENLTVMEGDFSALREQQAQTFDMVTLEGIWSWIPPNTRKALTSQIDHLLAPAGLVYVNYNCMPGWSSLSPVRDLLTKQTVLTGFDTALTQMKQELRQENGWFARHPAARALFQRICQRPAELQHQELAATMQPFWHSDVAETWVAYDIHPMCDLDPSGGPIRKAQKEDERDFHQNRLFRRDVFQRKGKPAHPGQMQYDGDLPSSGLDQAVTRDFILTLGEQSILPAGRIGNGVTLDQQEMAFLRCDSVEKVMAQIDLTTITNKDGHLLDGAEARDHIETAYREFRRNNLPRLKRYGIYQ